MQLLKKQTNRIPFSLFRPYLPQIPYLKTQLLSFSHKNPKQEDHYRDPQVSPKILVLQPRLKPHTLLHSKLNEALNLANSLEEQRDGCFATDFSDKQLPPLVVVQNPLSSSSKGRADTYFGPGTVKNIKCHINAAESEGDLDAVFVNATLSAIQQRNLERIWGKPVLDRVGLIIEIFNAHAYTKEAKLQAELAALMYKKTRLVRVRDSDGRYTFGSLGEAEVVSARGRGSGGRGFISGAGETELELQRRRISERRKHLLAEIAEVRRTRAVQRAARKKHGAGDGLGLATVAVVGYTNAGKSTLVSALSDTDMYSDDRLFATVDPRVRGVTLPSGRKVLLSDTVGFISDLPVQLVEAFHATLEEVVEADLLVHVLDSSAPNLEEQRKAVLDVLKQIGVSEKKIQAMIDVWNKIDYQGDDKGGNFEKYHYDANFVEDEDEFGDGQQMEKGETDYQKDEYTDGWLGLDTDEEQVYTSMGWTRSHNQKNVSGDESNMEAKSEKQPHVKTSAVTGVGLQGLLELIDEKLTSINEERRSETVVKRSVFDSKWRPPREKVADIS